MYPNPQKGSVLSGGTQLLGCTLALLLLLIGGASGWAQEAERYVSFEYTNIPLKQVISDLENRYDLRFSYSPNRLPLDYPLSASVQRKPVSQAMSSLFFGTPIQYAIVGGQVALRADAGQLSRLETPKPKPPRQQTPLYQEERRPVPPPIVTPLKREEQPKVSGGDSWLNKPTLDEDTKTTMNATINRHQLELQHEEYNANHRLAQISLLPYLGTNTYRSDQVSNTFSVNILWGTSRAVDGFEIGGIGNSVVEDVEGAQMAGVFNYVGGNVTGTQIAGMVNFTKGKMHGAQIAGLGNMAKDSVIGSQTAGFFNMGEYHVNGAQVASLWNSASGDVGTQVSLLYNQARRVSHRQVGFINVCESTEKAPIGFLSFVRYGYNRLEVGSSEAFYVNLSGKLGTRKLYNILHLGLRWDEGIPQDPGQVTSGRFNTWALGYGLGVAPRLAKKSLLNIEALAMHVNEQEVWTKKLNLLTQLRLTWDVQLGNGRWSLYAGPTANMMLSELYHPVTQTYGSIVPHNPFWNRQNGPTNVQAWLGFTAGIRL